MTHSRAAFALTIALACLLTACATPQQQTTTMAAPTTEARPAPQPNQKPIYPAEAKRLGQQGRVVVRVLIESDGRPSAAVIRESSGFPVLDQAALDSVKSWTYVPGKRNGVPEKMEFNVPITFTLN